MRIWLPDGVRALIEHDIAAGRTNAQITRLRLVSANIIEAIRAELFVLRGIGE